MLRVMNFTTESAAARDFLGVVDDAVGIWRCGGITVVCFATPETLQDLEALRDAPGTAALVLVNHQFFLDEFSRPRARQFLDACAPAYHLQSLNLKGAGLLPIKGVLARRFPGPFQAARRLDNGGGGGYAVLGEFGARPARAELEALFLRDSEERDRGLTLWDRLRRIRDEASRI